MRRAGALAVVAALLLPAGVADGKRRKPRPDRSHAVAGYRVVALGAPAGWWRAPRRTPAPAARPPEAAPGPGAPAPSSVAGPGVSAPTVAPPDRPVFHRVQARTTEFTITLSRPLVTAGDVDVEFDNSAAEDPHDLRLQPLTAGGPSFAFDELDAGGIDTRTLPLRDGTYELYCSLTGHRAAGMSAELAVSAR